jgi:parvulin-like peptidyl-prolyl isomerase
LAKKKATAVMHQPTKRQLSHWQKQTRYQRFILGAGISVIVIVFAMLGMGVYQWYKADYQPLREAVIEVNGHKFSMAYYIDALKFYSGGQTEYIQYMLDPVLENISQLELMRQEASKLGITVTEGEIDKEIQGNNLTNNQTVRDISRGQLLRDKLQAEYFGPKIPSFAEQRQAFAMFLESQAQLDALKSRIEAGEDFSTLATEFSLDSTSKDSKGDIGTHPQDIINNKLNTTVLEQAIFSQEVGKLSRVEDKDKTKSVGYWLVKVTARKDDLSEAAVSGMLLGSEQEALVVKARLDTGEDFTTLAQEFSQTWSDTDKDNLGSITTDSSDTFKDYVLSADTKLNVISNPIKSERTTSGGYWLFKVVEISVKEISADDKSTLTDKAFNDWLIAIQADTNNIVTSYITDGLKAFAATKAAGN